VAQKFVFRSEVHCFGANCVLSQELPLLLFYKWKYGRVPPLLPITNTVAVGVFVSLLFRTLSLSVSLYLYLSLSLSSLPLLVQSQKKALLRGWPRLSFCERPEHRQL